MPSDMNSPQEAASGLRSSRLAKVIVAFGVFALAIAVITAWAYRQSTSVSEIVPTMVAETDHVFAPEPGDCPGWLGQDAGAYNGSIPLEWDRKKNVEWSLPIESGHSSPICWGTSVFLGTANEETSTQSLVCVDMEKGELHWERLLHTGEFCPKHEKNTHASSTPFCDGRAVYTAFAVDSAIWVSGVDMTSGEILWQTEAGPYLAHQGFGASVRKFDDLIIVVGESRGSKIQRLSQTSFMAAIHCVSGKIIWRIRRPDEHSYGTPLLTNLSGVDQLVQIGGNEIRSYDPATGKSLWHCESDSLRSANTPATTDGLVFATGNYPDQLLSCLKPEGANCSVLWTARKGVSAVPTPLAFRDHILCMTDKGVLTSLNIKDGAIQWRERIGGNFSSSPIMVGEHLFVSDESGTTTVLKLGAERNIIARNSLDEPIFATPIVKADRILFRTTERLWSLRNE